VNVQQDQRFYGGLRGQVGIKFAGESNQQNQARAPFAPDKS